MEAQKIILATPLYNSQGWGNFIVSLVGAVTLLEKVKHLAPEKFDYDVWILEGSAYVDDARNIIAQRFLNSDGTHLFFLDSDVGATPEGFSKVLAAPYDVVGAAYRAKNAWHIYSAFLLTHPDKTPIQDPKTGALKTGSISTGFLKISRRAFERVRDAGLAPLYYTHGSTRPIHGYFNFIHEGDLLKREDLSFCLRCERAGVDMWCIPDVTLSHQGLKKFTGNFQDFLLSQSSDATKEWQDAAIDFVNGGNE